MIIVGAGDKVKIQGESGLYKCPHCNNECQFNVTEVAKNFHIFWITVARFSKKYYLTCGICNYGYELQKEELNDYIKK